MDATESSRVRRPADPGHALADADDSAPNQFNERFWKKTSCASVVGIFLLLFGALLYVAESLFAPVVAAAVVSTIFRTLSVRISRFKIPAALYAFVCVILFAVAINIALILLAGTLSDWASRAPEIGEALKTKAQILDRPLAALRDLHKAINSLLGGSGQDLKIELPTATLIAPAIGFLTPALGELVLFFGTLFFFIYGRSRQRSFLVFLFRGQEARLRTLKILNDVEQSLTQYIGMVSVINVAVGVVAGVIAYATGLQNPIFIGVLTFLLNYIPYVGAAIVTVVLFLFGVTGTPTLGTALIAPAIFVVIVTIEGHFITPNVVTRNLTVGPLTIFLSLAFWTWLWGPVGSFLATPILIVAVLIREHVFADESVKLPD